ncbi:MAG: YncE family protein [Chloroflexi bacterium]|nr:YncE family protein [Chloroflexota bacterium]
MLSMLKLPAMRSPAAVIVVVVALALLAGSSGAIAGSSGQPTFGQLTRPALEAAPAGAKASARAVAPSPASPADPAAGRVFIANEASGTVSAIDSRTNAVMATVCLGSDPPIPDTPQPAGPCNADVTSPQHHAPFYDGHLSPHGLWLTPDGAVLLVTNRISGTIVAIDARFTIPCPVVGCTNAILGYTPVGREPHLATVRPNGQEAWVAIRGESHIEVLKLDPAALFNPQVRSTDRMPKVATIDTVRGPSMVSFTSDGRFAFVAAGKQNRVDKIDAERRQVVASQTVPAPFTPFGLVSPDDQELYLVHKAAGSLSILRTGDLGFVVQSLPVGPRANHVYFVGNLAYITIGGPAPSAADPDPQGKIVIVDRATHAIVHELVGPEWRGEPHGIWATADGTRLFVGHERGDRLTVIDTGDPNSPSDDAIVATVTDPFLRQPIDIVIAPTLAPPSTPTPTPAGTPTSTPVVTATRTPAPTSTPMAAPAIVPPATPAITPPATPAIEPPSTQAITTPVPPAITPPTTPATATPVTATIGG